MKNIKRPARYNKVNAWRGSHKNVQTSHRMWKIRERGNDSNILQADLSSPITEFEETLIPLSQSVQHNVEMGLTEYMGYGCSHRRRHQLAEDNIW